MALTTSVNMKNIAICEQSDSSDSDLETTQETKLKELHQNGHSPGQLRGEVGPASLDTETDPTDTCHVTEQLDTPTHQSFSLLKMTNASANGLNKWLSKTNVIEKFGSTGTIADRSELRNRKKRVRRLVEKNGDLRVINIGMEEKNILFLKDGWTTLVDLQWRYLFLIFFASFLLSWLLFACIWHLLFWIHGDLEEEHLPDAELVASGNYTPCVYSIYDFTSTFLFSLETQHTIGYGYRGTSHKCIDAVILQCCQSILGVIIQACMAGIVFAKLSRPKRRATTILFSKHAVISQTNGLLRLMFRVANVRHSQLLESHFKGIILAKITTEEGILIKHHQTEIPVSWQLDDKEDEPADYGHVLLPVIVSHIIDQDSPLYNLAPADFNKAKFEFIVTLEGVVEPSGNTTQARTSYLPQEILWGYHFKNCIHYAKKENVYAVDLSQLNTVVADNTPSPTKSQASTRKHGESTRNNSINGDHQFKMIDEED